MYELWDIFVYRSRYRFSGYTCKCSVYLCKEQILLPKYEYVARTFSGLCVIFLNFIVELSRFTI